MARYDNIALEKEWCSCVAFIVAFNSAPEFLIDIFGEAAQQY